MYLRNAWYVIAEADELKRQPLARTVLDEPLVMYRTQAGKPVALYDRCAHRQAPLSLGEIVGDDIRCNYHGLVYDCTGACTHVPGQIALPPGTRVRSYPAVERYNWIWAWMGDPAMADEARIPDFHWNDDPAWVTTGERMVMKGNYQLLVDNLLDLSHLGYLHRKTIGTESVAEHAHATTQRLGDQVRVERVTRDQPPPPLWRQSRGFNDNIDRWQIIEFTPPATVIIESSGAPAGVCKTDEDRWNYPMQMVLNFVTPRTEGSLHYFWRNARNYKLEDASLTRLMYEQVHATFLEDTEMVEGQQRNLDIDPKPPMIDINFDAGSIEARRVMARLIAAE